MEGTLTAGSTEIIADVFIHPTAARRVVHVYFHVADLVYSFWVFIVK